MLDPLREFDKDIVKEEPAPGEAEIPLPSSGDDTRSRTVQEAEWDIANVAVVFVHGMGTSRPGDMLESYMNPSLEWIKRATTDDNSWFQHNELDQNLVEGVNILERQRKPGQSPVTRNLTESPQHTSPEESPTISHEVDVGRMRNALLHSTETTPDIFQPPYVEVDLILRDGDTTITKKLVALEAWWDGEFEAPTDRTAFIFDAVIEDISEEIATNDVVRGTLTLRVDGAISRHWKSA